MSAYSRLNKTHPFLQTSIALYCNPSRHSIVVAAPSLLGNEFGEGKITLENSCSNSVMHALLILCVRQTFITNNVVSNLDSPDPQNKGVVYSSLIVVVLGLSVRQLSGCSAVSSTSMLSSSLSDSELAVVHDRVSSHEATVIHTNVSTITILYRCIGLNKPDPNPGQKD